jgi:GH35 family endo-1,4-beta-xylanase
MEMVMFKPMYNEPYEVMLEDADIDFSAAHRTIRNLVKELAEKGYPLNGIELALYNTISYECSSYKLQRNFEIHKEQKGLKKE